MTQRYSRRQVLAGGVSGAAALGLAKVGPVRSAGADSVRRALQVKPATSGTVEHVVFLMQENRSFDHYFGTMKGVSRVRRHQQPAAPSPRRGTPPTAAPVRRPTSNRPMCCSRST